MGNKTRDLNRIFLNRRQSIIMPLAKEQNEEEKEVKRILTATLNKNLEAYGYRLSEQLCNAMLKADTTEIIGVYSQLMEHAKETAGDVGSHKPFYPGFPQQVMEKSEAELYLNALIYYWTGLAPSDCVMDKEKEENLIKVSKGFEGKIREIGLAGEKDIYTIYANLCSSPAAFAPQDLEDIKAMFTWEHEDILSSTPEKIPNKENLCSLTNLAMQNYPMYMNPFIYKYKTATDVLRFVNVLNDGDAALTETAELNKTSHQQKKFIGALFDNIKDPDKDIAMRPEQFKRVVHQYHLGRYCKTDRMRNAIDRLYKGELAPSYQSRLTRGIDNIRKAGTREDFVRGTESLMKLLSENPGYMAVNMASLLDTLEKSSREYGPWAVKRLVSTFHDNIGRIEANTLLRMEGGLAGAGSKYKVYAANKGLSQPYLKVNAEAGRLTETFRQAADEIIKITDNGLKEKYSNKRPLGKVYIDPMLNEVKLPKQQRMKSGGTIQMPSGSRFPLQENKDHIRAFVWWTNAEHDVEGDYNYGSRVDVDLSFSYYDKNFNSRGVTSYYSLKDDFACHSGDITDGGPFKGEGVSEYIDIDLNKAKEQGIGYVTFSLNSFTHIPFNEFPCKFGWMEYEREMEGVYDPGKVKNAISIDAGSQMTTPVVYDVGNRQFVWLDEHHRAGKNFNMDINNVTVHAGPLLAETIRAAADTSVTLGHLLKLHTEGRDAELVESPLEADTAFTLNRLNADEMGEHTENITARDIDYISGELISSELTGKDREYFEELAKEQEKAAAEETISIE